MWKKFYLACWNAVVRGHFKAVDWCNNLLCQRVLLYFREEKGSMVTSPFGEFLCLYCPHENSESLLLKKVSWEMTWKLRKFLWNVLLQFYSHYQVYPWESGHASINLKERSQSAKVGQCAGIGVQGAFSQSFTPSSVFAGETWGIQSENRKHSWGPLLHHHKQLSYSSSRLFFDGSQSKHVLHVTVDSSDKTVKAFL